MANTKMTNKGAIEFVINTYGAEIPADVLEKLEKIKVSFEKKSASKKVTEKQEKNGEYKDRIVEILTDAGKALTIQEIQAEEVEFADFNTSKMSALLTQLRTEGKVVRTYDKKKAYFGIA